MICHNCKKRIPKESRYCKYCGAPQFYDANYRYRNDSPDGKTPVTNPYDDPTARAPHERRTDPAAFETPLPDVRRTAASPAAMIAAFAALIVLIGACVWIFSIRNEQRKILQAQTQEAGNGGSSDTDGSGYNGNNGSAPGTGIIEGTKSTAEEEAGNSPEGEAGNPADAVSEYSPAEEISHPAETETDHSTAEGTGNNEEASPPENAAAPEKTQSRVTLDDPVPKPKNSSDTPAASAPDYTAWNGVWEFYAPEGYLEAQLTFDCSAGSDVADCSLFFYRLMNADVTVSFTEGSSVGVIRDNAEKLSGTVELGEDKISLHLNDDEPVYFDETPSQFFGRTDFTYTRQQ